ncbi:exo-beta-N-acetylmuramidase NamZ domain-containing protein [Halalkalibaculum sp. DA3122]|uniref:exo-beta-N-acetylmuramidase NamZ family protein n=1 Tax=Halalkalibaculum sp. DA3122 TaxID=3373607 RepID=UPI003754B996
MNIRFGIFFLLLSVMACHSSGKQEAGNHPGKVKVGAEVLVDKHLDELAGKRVGLVMNPTARIGDTHMLDTLVTLGVNVTALFAPEHGFRGEAGAGEVIENGIDQETGLPVYSLYGETKKPTPEMLEKVDLLLFDMQDVGARFYTYNVTLGLVLEAAAAADLPVWILDRPNPAGGEYMAGWILEEQYTSFVGAYPIPMAHGMTLGELAKMMIGERWIEFEEEPALRVIPAENWERSMKWPETGLRWHAPSPNLPAFEHAYMYLGTVLFEGTNISEGRGTDHPFLTIGSPTTQIHEKALSRLRNRYSQVNIKRIQFTPQSIPGKAVNPKFEGEQCRGVRLSIKSYDFDPVAFGMDLLQEMAAATANAETTDFIYKLAGSGEVTRFQAGWDEDIKRFRQTRMPYLIY